MRTFVKKGSKGVYSTQSTTVGEWEDRCGKTFTVMEESHVECENIPVLFEGETEIVYLCTTSGKDFPPDCFVDY